MAKNKRKDESFGMNVSVRNSNLYDGSCHAIKNVSM